MPESIGSGKPQRKRMKKCPACGEPQPSKSLCKLCGLLLRKVWAALGERIDCNRRKTTVYGGHHPDELDRLAELAKQGLPLPHSPPLPLDQLPDDAPCKRKYRARTRRGAGLERPDQG